MSDFDFDVDIPIPKGYNKGITLIAKSMPIGASKWYSEKVMSKCLYQAIYRLKNDFAPVIRAEDKDGIPGWRVWKIEKKAKP